MKHYRIYFLAGDGRINSKPVELEAELDSEVVMRALMAEPNLHGAEVWCGATLVRRIETGRLQQAFPKPDQGPQPEALH